VSCFDLLSSCRLPSGDWLLPTSDFLLVGGYIGGGSESLACLGCLFGVVGSGLRRLERSLDSRGIGCSSTSGPLSVLSGVPWGQGMPDHGLGRCRSWGRHARLLFCQSSPAPLSETCTLGLLLFPRVTRRVHPTR
jgi:hypothetical protein